MEALDVGLISMREQNLAYKSAESLLDIETVTEEKTMDFVTDESGVTEARILGYTKEDIEKSVALRIA
jgi:hypothetical protein